MRLLCPTAFCEEENAHTISIRQAESAFCHLAAQVNDTHEPILIRNDKGANCVLVSERDWKAIWETIELNAIPGMAQSIREGGSTPTTDCLPEKEISW